MYINYLQLILKAKLTYFVLGCCTFVVIPEIHLHVIKTDAISLYLRVTKSTIDKCFSYN
jgi:hypothetical protein